MLNIKEFHNEYFVLTKRENRIINGMINFLKDYCNAKKIRFKERYNIDLIINDLLDNDSHAKFFTVWYNNGHEMFIEDFYLGKEYEDDYCRGDNLNDLKKWLQMMEE